MRKRLPCAHILADLGRAEQFCPLGFLLWMVALEETMCGHRCLELKASRRIPRSCLQLPVLAHRGPWLYACDSDLYLYHIKCCHFRLIHLSPWTCGLWVSSVPWKARAMISVSLWFPLAQVLSQAQHENSATPSDWWKMAISKVNKRHHVSHLRKQNVYWNAGR